MLHCTLINFLVSGSQNRRYTSDIASRSQCYTNCFFYNRHPSQRVLNSPIMLHSNPAQHSNEVPEGIFCTVYIPCTQAITAMVVNVIWKSKNNICPPLYFTDWYMEWSPKFEQTIGTKRKQSIQMEYFTGQVGLGEYFHEQLYGRSAMGQACVQHYRMKKT